MNRFVVGIYAATCVALLTCTGCLTGPDDPDDAVGEPVPQGEGVREELKYDWETETSPTAPEPAFPQEEATDVADENEDEDEA